VDRDIIAKTPLEELYILNGEDYVPYLENKISEIKASATKSLLYVKESGYLPKTQLEINDTIWPLYFKEGSYVRSNLYYKYDNYGRAEEEPT
jgi:hypothetical protein